MKADLVSADTLGGRWPAARQRTRLLLLVCVLFILIPPSLAYGWTRYRYASGTLNGPVSAHTSGALTRQYNSFYFSDVGTFHVGYKFDLSYGEWQGATGSQSPVSLGSSGSFLVYSLCSAYGLQSFGGAYNCDTTVP